MILNIKYNRTNISVLYTVSFGNIYFSCIGNGELVPMASPTLRKRIREAIALDNNKDLSEYPLLPAHDGMFALHLMDEKLHADKPFKYKVETDVGYVEVTIANGKGSEPVIWLKRVDHSLSVPSIYFFMRRETLDVEWIINNSHTARIYTDKKDLIKIFADTLNEVINILRCADNIDELRILTQSAIDELGLRKKYRACTLSTGKLDVIPVEPTPVDTRHVAALHLENHANVLLNTSSVKLHLKDFKVHDIDFDELEGLYYVAQRPITGVVIDATNLTNTVRNVREVTRYNPDIPIILLLRDEGRYRLEYVKCK